MKTALEKIVESVDAGDLATMVEHFPAAIAPKLVALIEDVAKKAFDKDVKEFEDSDPKWKDNKDDNKDGVEDEDDEDDDEDDDDKKKVSEAVKPRPNGSDEAIKMIAQAASLQVNAVKGFIEEHGLDAVAMVTAIRGTKKLDASDLSTAIAGNPNNSFAKEIIAAYKK